MEMFDKPGVWLKGNLHCHTTASDGVCTPQQTCRLYRDAGYDFLALTDCRRFYEPTGHEPLTVLSGGEWTVCVGGTSASVVGVGMRRAPEISPAEAPTAKEVIAAIRAAGGLAFWAQPGQLLVAPEDILKEKDALGLAICCTATADGDCGRAAAGNLADMVLTQEPHYRLLGTGNPCTSAPERGGAFIFLKADGRGQAAVFEALRRGDFYASGGPELYQITLEGDRLTVDCSPVVRAFFLGDACWTPNRAVYGQAMTHLEYKIQPYEHYVRFEAYDAKGRGVWSQPIIVRQGGGENA